MTSLLVRLVLLALLQGALSSPVAAQALGRPEREPAGRLQIVINSPVDDQAGVLTPDERATLSQRVRALRLSTGAQLAVLTVQSTNEEPLADFSHRIAEAWGGGQKGRDDGLLLTIVIGEARMRLEVGYGLEGTIPDAIARQVLERVGQQLKEKRYREIVEGVLTQLEERLSAAKQPGQTASSGGSDEQSNHQAKEPPPAQDLSDKGLVVFLAVLSAALGTALGAINRFRKGSKAAYTGNTSMNFVIAFAIYAVVTSLAAAGISWPSIVLFILLWATFYSRATGLSWFGQGLTLCPLLIGLVWYLVRPDHSDSSHEVLSTLITGAVMVHLFLLWFFRQHFASRFFDEELYPLVISEPEPATSPSWGRSAGYRGHGAWGSSAEVSLGSDSNGSSDWGGGGGGGGGGGDGGGGGGGGDGGGGGGGDWGGGGGEWGGGGSDSGGS